MIIDKHVAAADAPQLDRSAQSVQAPSDSGYGVFMFFMFILAVLVVTVMVCVLAVVGSWWMLGVAIAVHVLMTTAVMGVVMGAFGPLSEAYPDLAVAPQTPTATAQAVDRSRRPERRRVRPMRT